MAVHVLVMYNIMYLPYQFQSPLSPHLQLLSHQQLMKDNNNKNNNNNESTKVLNPRSI